MRASRCLIVCAFCLLFAPSLSRAGEIKRGAKLVIGTQSIKDWFLTTEGLNSQLSVAGVFGCAIWWGIKHKGQYRLALVPNIRFLVGPQFYEGSWYYIKLSLELSLAIEFVFGKIHLYPKGGLAMNWLGELYLGYSGVIGIRYQVKEKLGLFFDFGYSGWRVSRLSKVWLGHGFELCVGVLLF